MKLKVFFQNHSKLFIFDLEFEFRDLILMEKIPHTPYLCLLLLLNFVVLVSVSVSAESIGQLQFRFRYWAETKMVVSVVHYKRQGSLRVCIQVYEFRDVEMTCFLGKLEIKTGDFYSR